jgi:hypothetical protein
MSTIYFDEMTTATPEQFIAGLTDFGPGRAKLFPNSADSYLAVHHLGAHEADVTEGSGGVWERLHYDWCIGLQLHLEATGQRNDRRRRRHRPRGQKLQGTGSFAPAGDRRQALVAKGIRSQRQGHRSP